jgi:hypothetical protein
LKLTDEPLPSADHAQGTFGAEASRQDYYHTFGVLVTLSLFFLQKGVEWN